jgi:hypothetical protein
MGDLHFNQIQVLNLEGKELTNTTGNFTGTITIQMKDLAQGFYLLKISGSQQAVIKIFKN